MKQVEIYTKRGCPFCTRAKNHLERKAVQYQEIDVTEDPVREGEMIERSGRHTVPQIFIGGHSLGGSDDLRSADASGYLDWLLSSRAIGKAA